MKNNYQIPKLPLPIDIETKAVLKQVNAANKRLAELKGVVEKIPNEQILINSLILQEAKDSSAIENIVTTHDDIFKAHLDFSSIIVSNSTKEVLNYAEAIKKGFELTRNSKIITNNNIQSIQNILENNTAGFRSVHGTTLKNQFGDIVYTPPQNQLEIKELMNNLELFINQDELSEIDPLIKMAIIHHQFESIHPFCDGNGRTGRIINVLYLVIKDLIKLPILYLSRYIIQNKSEYYRLLQSVRDNNEWENWVIFMLKGIEETAYETIDLVKNIFNLMMKYKHELRPLLSKTYRHEFLNNLFKHPYTKIEFVMQDMNISRLTAAKHLDKLVANGFLRKIKQGRSNYYLNIALIDLLTQSNKGGVTSNEQVLTDNPL